MDSAVAQVLDASHYKEVNFFGETSSEDMFEAYGDAARAISVKDNSFRKALFSDTRNGFRGMIANLNITVMTHKPNSKVVCRAIHNYIDCPMAPGMRCVMKCLNERLIHLPHLVRDTTDLLAKASRVKLTRTCRFIKFDIKDFYMSGSFEELTMYSSLAVDPAVRDNFKLLLDAILNSQYVSSPAQGKVHKVTVGTGMGMLASGHVADAAFYEMVERPFILRTSTRKEFSLLFYARFKDDGLLIFDAQDGIQRIADFMDRIHEVSKCFTVKLESISRIGCQMLDVFVSCSDFLRPHFRLYTKPSIIWQPLSPESAHHISIHRHWPLAQCCRIRSRFSSAAEGDAEVLSFIKSFYEATGVLLVEEQQKSTKIKPKNASSWLVLPFNFVLSNSTFARAISDLRVPEELPFINVRVSWSLGSQHLMHLLRRHGRDRLM